MTNNTLNLFENPTNFTDELTKISHIQLISAHWLEKIGLS